MSLYKVKPNYQRLYESLFDNYGYSVDVDPHTMDFILEIKDEKKASSFTEEEWSEKVVEATEYDNKAMMMALINSPYLPESCQWQLFDEMDETDILLTSKHLKSALIYEIYSYYGSDFKNIVLEQGRHFSNKVLDFLCFDLKRDDLENVLEFTPFEFLHNSPDTLNKINRILSKDNIPEKLSIAIAENVNLPESVRNQAFDIGYNPSRLSSSTEHMLTELYKTYAETVFDVVPQTNEEAKAIKSATDKLTYYASYNHLPESCQIDLIERCAKDKMHDSIALRVIYNTKYPSVLATAQKSLSIENLSQKILENPTAINDKVIRELLKDADSKKLNSAFVQAIFKRSFSQEVVEDFIENGNISIKRAIVCSYKSTPNQVDTVLQNSVGKKHYRELLYLKELRDTCINFVDADNIQNIMSTALLGIMKKEHNKEKAMPTFKALREAISSEEPQKWSTLYQNDQIALNRVLTNLHKSFPEFQDITEKLLNKVEKTYINSKLVLKYKDILKGRGTKQEQFDVPFDYFDVKSFIELTEDKQKEFIKEIKENGDAEICKKISNDILCSCDDSDCYHDIVAMNVYKCGELFEAVDDIVHPQTKEEKEVPSTDDYYTFR